MPGTRMPSLAAALGLPFLLAGLATVQAQDDPRDLELRTQQVFRAALARVAPSVVKIETIGGAAPVREEDGPMGMPVAPGFRQADGPTTGVICSPDGYIITSSFNFMRDPAVITVSLGDGRRFVARLVARDRATRLALLWIEATDLPAVEWLPADQVLPGQWSLAAGYGFGSGLPAVSVGVVSGLRRMNGLALQTDAKISPANYGGPLFDLEGRVMGVLVPMGPGDDELAGVEWYDSGIGFAISSDVVLARAARLREGKDLARGLLGVVIEAIDPVVGVVPEAEGLKIHGAPRGPAEKAGLKADDLVTHIDGQPTRTLLALRRAIARKVAGDPVELTYRRGEITQTTVLTLARAEELAGESPASAPASQPVGSEER